MTPYTEIRLSMCRAQVQACREHADEALRKGDPVAYDYWIGKAREWEERVKEG